MDQDRAQHEGDTKCVVRAAQYVRTFTEHQKYSTGNQAEAIAAYAARCGFEIVQTYEDAGKSSLRMHGRASVTSGSAFRQMNALAQTRGRFRGIYAR